MGRLPALATGIVVGVDETVIILLGAGGHGTVRHAATLAAGVVVGMHQAVIVIVVHRHVSG
jgi:hypothetical protein